MQGRQRPNRKEAPQRGNTYPPKNTKERNPQGEEYQIPHPDQREPEDGRDAVEDARQGGKARHDDGVDPFPIGVKVCLSSAVEVDAVERADGDGESELGEVEEREEQVAQRDAAEGHLGGGAARGRL